jgi:hypothetical protein
MKSRAFLAGIILGLVGFGAGLLAQGSPQEPRPGDFIDSRDIAFRVEGMRGDRVVGTFVVRVGERWLETEPVPPPAVLPAPSRR